MKFDICSKIIFSELLTKRILFSIIRILLRKRGSKNKQLRIEIKNSFHELLTKGNDFYMISILR